MRREIAEKWHGIVQEWIRDRDPELEELVELSELFEVIAANPQRRKDADQEYFDAHEKHGTEPELPDELKPNGRQVDKNDKDRGWGWPMNARKRHYFVGSESLYGNWVYGGLTLENDDNELGFSSSITCCKHCARELEKLKAKEAA